MPGLPPTPDKVRNCNLEKALVCARLEVQQLSAENHKLKTQITDAECQVILRDEALKMLENDIKQSRKLIKDLIEKSPVCECQVARRATYSEVLKKGEKQPA